MYAAGKVTHSHPTHLLQDTENHGDLFCVEQPLGHQRQTGLCIPFQLIVTIIILNWSNLEQQRKKL